MPIVATVAHLSYSAELLLQLCDKVHWFMPVDLSKQPRNVKRWRPRALLPSIFPASSIPAFLFL